MKVVTRALGRLPVGLTYDPETGTFRHSRGHRAGRIAGTVTKRGYIQLVIDGRTFLAHRVAWFFGFGEWPAREIDHINGCKSDNRLANLREVDHALNMENYRRPRSDSTSGYLGVSKARRGRFQSKIQVSGKTKFLGLFDTAHEAHQAYLAAKRELHEGCTL